MRSRRKIIVAGVTAALVVFVAAAHVRLWLQANGARVEHMQALGRSIPMSWHEGSPTTITVPSTAAYQVRTVKPYNYALRLRSGYNLPTTPAERKPGSVIAYFVAAPDYPWWYVADIFGLEEAEVLTLDELYAVYAHPKSWLTAQRPAF